MTPIYRTFDTRGMEDMLLEGTIGYTREDWFLEDNIVLSNGRDYSLFKKERPGVYSGHVFFRARGKEALAIAKDMLSMIFSMGAEAIIGLTPEDKKSIVWFNIKIGFTPYGKIDTLTGPAELFILTKKEFLSGLNL